MHSFLRTDQVDSKGKYIQISDIDWGLEEKNMYAEDIRIEEG
jgi:hypothetical protein